MARTELQYMDANSSKFWHIELTDTSHTVTYGRTGTSGQSKTKAFESTEKAEADYNKLVSQKRKKGYVDVAAAGEGAASDGTLPAIAFPRAIKEAATSEHTRTFIGKRVVDYKGDSGKSDGSVAYRIAADYDNDNFDEDLARFLGGACAQNTEGLVIGSWSAEEMFDQDSSGVVQALVAGAAKLPRLLGLFLCDVVQEECELSWIQQSDVSPLLGAFPNLELLRVRGGQGLRLNDARHPKLRALALETGGMDVEVVRSICSGDFPNLEYLELWIGTEEYGGSSSVQDLQPILSGKLFPKLKYLGLRNCDYVDDIAGVVVSSPIVDRIETLDLSLGTMTDAGGRSLLSLPAGGTLKRLNLYHHFMSAEVTRQLQGLGLTVETGGRENAHDDWRYVAVGE